MSYVVEQKIKGRIYLYEVTSYSDKEKKQARQKRKYLGPKERKNIQHKKKGNEALQQTRPISQEGFQSKNYGDVYLLETLTEELGLGDILKTHFPTQYKEILGLAYHDILRKEADYMFPYFLEDSFLPEMKKIDSSGISSLMEEIGKMESDRMCFLSDWIVGLKSDKGVYYDITSISGYARNIEYIEWGYNRDGENLAQVNLGLVYCSKTKLPCFYRNHPGSLTDVTTLKNCLRYMEEFGMKDNLFVLDRGFHSLENIKSMLQSEMNLKFIQPLPKHLKSVKDIIQKYKDSIQDIKNLINYNDEILGYVREEIEIDGYKCQLHVFRNEKMQVELKNDFIKKLNEIEKQKLPANKISKEDSHAMIQGINQNFRKCFIWNPETERIERNYTEINRIIAGFGFFVVLTNKEDLTPMQVLKQYRKRDEIEKVYKNLKNESEK